MTFEEIRLFGDRFIGERTSAARSRDVTPPVFLWGLLKGRVFKNKPALLKIERKHYQRNCCYVTPAEMLANVYCRVGPCHWKEGKQFHLQSIHSHTYHCILQVFFIGKLLRDIIIDNYQVGACFTYITLESCSKLWIHDKSKSVLTWTVITKIIDLVWCKVTIMCE